MVQADGRREAPGPPSASRRAHSVIDSNRILVIIVAIVRAGKALWGVNVMLTVSGKGHTAFATNRKLKILAILWLCVLFWVDN